MATVFSAVAFARTPIAVALFPLANEEAAIATALTPEAIALTPNA